MPAQKYICDSFMCKRNCNKHHGQVTDIFASYLGGHGSDFSPQETFCDLPQCQQTIAV
jgi:hypothetical protein